MYYSYRAAIFGEDPSELAFEEEGEPPSRPLYALT